MSNEERKGNYFWKGAVAVLILVLCVQTFFTYRALNSRREVSPIALNKEESVTLKPRSITVYPNQAAVSQQTASQQAKQAPVRQLAMPPLPQVSLNMNNVSGVKPAPPQQVNQINQPQNQTMRSRMSCMPSGMMSIRSQNPFDMDMRAEMAEMEAMMDSMLADMGGHRPHFPSFGQRVNHDSAPSVSVDKDQNYIVKLKIPGLDKSEVKADVTGNILTVSGVRKEEQTVSNNGGNSYMSSYSSFQNSFSLPGPAKSDGLKMNYDGDTLTIRVPRA